ncbi:DUF5677 domain-containing protein [Streptomyces sp. NPDC091281]|uniref:DUF5677 domain-containing protein n=1 Tax=Streptomyces sp. NPDC091281 TaxID=3365985 RepID=UPI0037F8F1D0
MHILRKRRNSSIDDKFHEYVMKIIEESGIEVTEEQALTDIAAGSVEKFADRMGTRVADHALKNRKSFRANRKMDQGFNRRLYRRYKSAFEAYAIASACAREAGEEVATKPRESLTDSQAATLHALISIHAKACRISGEVYALLGNGYPEGALARCRTMHEMAVIAGSLADCVDDPDNNDLAIRYLDHEVVDLLSSAKQYQADHITLGMEPLEAGYLDQLQDRYDAAIAKYGPDFKGQYGWAKKYCPNANFAGLENRVRMSHMRGYYKWANNEVHAGSRSLSLNVSTFRGQRALRAGKINVGLTEPASMALNSLYQITVALLVKGLPSDINLTGLVTMKALDELRIRAPELFQEAADEIRKDEAKYASR